MKQRNPQARALRDPRFRPRTVKPRKGRGSYTRKARSAKREGGPYDSAPAVVGPTPRPIGRAPGERITPDPER